ncbi:MAG: NUDIX domain-containing protein [Myxococcota bacterium]
MVRRFGVVVPGREVYERRGAYGVIVDPDWRIAVVVVRGESFLPGGGIEAGETAEQAVHREIAEETGLAVEIVARMGEAAEWIPHRHRLMDRRGTFFACRPTGYGVAIEPDHQLVWRPPTAAMAELALQSDRWMVRRALGPC